MVAYVNYFLDDLNMRFTWAKKKSVLYTPTQINGTN